MAAGYALSYVVGAAFLARLLRARLGGLDGRRVVRTVVRVLVASGLGAAVAYAVDAATRHTVGGSLAGALVSLPLAAAAGGALYVLAASRMRVAEVHDVVTLVLRRAGRNR